MPGDVKIVKSIVLFQNMATKRKDFTPKKDQEKTNKKCLRNSFIDLTSDDSDECISSQAPRSPRKRLSFGSEESQVKDEPIDIDDYLNDFDERNQADSDYLDGADKSSSENRSTVQYYRDNKNLPLHGTKNPDVEEIFRICLLGDIPAEKYVKEKPLRIKHTSTFVVKPDLIKLKHPYDLEADDTPGVFKKHHKVRFYEAKQTDGGELILSSEVHVTKNRNGQVTNGTYNR